MQVHEQNMKAGQFTCLSFLSPNESPAFLLLLTEFFQSQLLTTLVHQKLSLRGSRKHPLLSPIVFLPVCLRDTPPSQFTWTLRVSSGQGGSLAMPGASSCSGPECTSELVITGQHPQSQVLWEGWCSPALERDWKGFSDTGNLWQFILQKDGFWCLLKDYLASQSPLRKDLLLVFCDKYNWSAF